MSKIKILLIICLLFRTFASCEQNKKITPMENSDKPELNISNADWKQKLTPQQYHITREGGTEYPYTGKYYNFYEKGI
jgi:peptide-methionine (R)-S-oxide reductase